MLIFIDESGDAGFKTKSGSSEYFIFAFVLFQDVYTADLVSKRIRSFKAKNGFSSSYEFKFNKTKKKLKIGFLEEVCKEDFEIRIFVIEKNKKKYKKISAVSNYTQFLISALLKNQEVLNDSVIFLDGLGSREFRRLFKAKIRKTLIAKDALHIKDFKFVESKNNGLIQLADMVAGSVRRSYQKEKSDSNLYVNILGEKIACIEYI